MLHFINSWHKIGYLEIGKRLPHSGPGNMSFYSQQNVERKILAILKVLSGLQKPAGFNAKRLKNAVST
jgi:hypothetical protein